MSSQVASNWEDAIQDGLMRVFLGKYDYAFAEKFTMYALVAAFGLYRPDPYDAMSHRRFMAPEQQEEEREETDYNLLAVVDQTAGADQLLALKQIDSWVSALPATERWLAEALLDGASPLEIAAEHGARPVEVMRAHKALKQGFLRLV